MWPDPSTCLCIGGTKHNGTGRLPANVRPLLIATIMVMVWLIKQRLTSQPTQYRWSGRQFYRSNSIKVLKENRYKGKPRKTNNTKYTYTVWVKKKSPPTVFWNFFPNGWGFLINFLHIYYTIISTLEYKFLFKYLHLWQSYAILSATT